MAKWQEVPISEARASLGELVMQVYYKGGGITLTKNGKPVAAIIPQAAAERVQADQQRAINALEKIHELNIGAEMTDEEWEAFVQSEVDAVRNAQVEKSRANETLAIEHA